VDLQGIARVTVKHSAAQRLVTLTLERLALAGSQFQSSFASLEFFELFDAQSSER
jgi:hypothetical protein